MAIRSAARRALGRMLPLGVWGLVGCTAAARAPSPADAAAVQRAALATLFLEREHAARLVLWRGPLADAPALGGLARSDTLPAGDVDPRALALPIPVDTVGVRAVEAHFRDHPDAWRAWFARYPGSPGLVELTAPRAVGDDGTRAELLVGRSGGEHCRMAWRMRVRRDAGGVWRTEWAAPLAVSGL